jgi:hypothetical protein
MLRISGVELDVDLLVRSTALIPEAIHRKGEPRLSTRPNGPKTTTSGASFVVSDAGFDQFKIQKEDAIAFLTTNRQELQRIMSFPGIEGACLDFGIYWRDVPMQCDHFPSELVAIAGELGLGIELSQYCPSEEDEESQQGAAVQPPPAPAQR